MKVLLAIVLGCVLVVWVFLWIVVAFVDGALRANEPCVVFDASVLPLPLNKRTGSFDIEGGRVSCYRGDVIGFVERKR